MKKYQVVFCDGNTTMTANATAYFRDDSDLSVIVCNSPSAAEDILESRQADALIIDVTFSGCKELIMDLPSPRPKIIVTSRLMEDEIGNYLKNLKYDACFYKPYSFVELRDKLVDVLNGEQPIEFKSTTTSKAMDERLSNIFIRAGIPPHIKGYQFLREAVKQAVHNPEMINSITKKLYPSVANVFSTSASKVERAIRHAIEVAWNRGKIENINAIFGIKIYSRGDKPTNGELIALVADKVMIEMMQ